MSNYEIRAKAREQLGGKIFATNWLYALVIMLIVQAVLSISSFTAILPLILTGPLTVGVASIFLGLTRDKKEIKLEDAFGGFVNNIGDNIVLGLLISLFTALWSLLFLIPGIIKAYSYSMSYYIKNDHPEYTWQQCIDESRHIMDGNKAKLFLLDLSFIGWIIVGMLCFGIGVLWVTPYMEAAHANFYEDIR